MNVTGVEWRDLDPHETRFAAGDRRRHPPKPAEPEDDVVEIHGEEDDAPGEKDS